MPVPGMPRRMMPATAASPRAVGTPWRFGPSSPVASTPWQVEQFAENSSLPFSGSGGGAGVVDGGSGGGACADALRTMRAFEIRTQAVHAVAINLKNLAEFTLPPMPIIAQLI